MPQWLILGFCRLWKAGLSPIMPGTCGTAVACLLAPWLFLPLSPWGRILLLLILFVLGSLAASRAEVLLGCSDPGEVVIDELVGVWLVLLPFAYDAERIPWPLLFLAFLLFRIFDMLKPGPVRASEHWLPRGWGVMLDDVVAGVLAMLCLCVLHSFLGERLL